MHPAQLHRGVAGWPRRGRRGLDVATARRFRIAEVRARDPPASCSRAGPGRPRPGAAEIGLKPSIRPAPNSRGPEVLRETRPSSSTRPPSAAVAATRASCPRSAPSTAAAAGKLAWKDRGARPGFVQVLGHATATHRRRQGQLATSSPSSTWSRAIRVGRQVLVEVRRDRRCAPPYGKTRGEVGRRVVVQIAAATITSTRCARGWVGAQGTQGRPKLGVEGSPLRTATTSRRRSRRDAAPSMVALMCCLVLNQPPLPSTRSFGAQLRAVEDAARAKSRCARTPCCPARRAIVVTVKDACSQAPGVHPRPREVRVAGVHLIYTYPDFEWPCAVDRPQADPRAVGQGDGAAAAAALEPDAGLGRRASRTSRPSTRCSSTTTAPPLAPARLGARPSAAVAAARAASPLPLPRGTRSSTLTPRYGLDLLRLRAAARHRCSRRTSKIAATMLYSLAAARHATQTNLRLVKDARPRRRRPPRPLAPPRAQPRLRLEGGRRRPSSSRTTAS